MLKMLKNYSAFFIFSIFSIVPFILFVLFILSCISISLPVYAKNFGNIGQVYPIAEPDLLDFIETRLKQMEQNGELETIKKHMIEQTKKHAERPIPVSGITRTSVYAKREFDPSVMISHDILDHDGNVIAKAGTTINPLKTVSLREALVFYDGDDKDQMAWVLKIDKKFNGKDKFILVNGSVPEQSKQFKKQIFFDQQGRLTEKLKIKHVPALVTQDGLYLKVEEFVP